MQTSPVPAFLTVLLFFLVSCSSSASLVNEEPEPVGFAPFYVMDRNVEPDEEIDAFLAPLRRQYEEKMSLPVTVAEGDFSLGRPESSLGNLVADIIRYRASLEMHRFVHVSLVDPAHLKTEIREGAVTTGDLYELLPYDHTLVVLEVEGRQLLELADEIAERGGVPLSGMRLTISGGKAGGILVDSGTPDPDETYYLATSSEVAGGRSGYGSLGSFRERFDFPLLLRDMLITYMSNRSRFAPAEDLRIRNSGE